MWQKMSFCSPPLNINVISGKTLFLHKDFIKNSNIDVGGGKSVPKILYEVDMCACDGKKENKIHFAKLFCPGLYTCSLHNDVQLLRIMTEKIIEQLLTLFCYHKKNSAGRK